MQAITKQLSDAIRGDYQVPTARLEIYNKDGTLAGEILDVLSVNTDTANSRKVLRQFSVTINDDEGLYAPDPDQYDRNFLWYNKTAKVFFGYDIGGVVEELPQGEFTIDSIKPMVTPDGVVVSVEGQDKMSRLIEDKFDDVYKVEDPAATESVNWALTTSGASAAATSSVTAGDEIQSQARIYYVTPFASINGIVREVTNEEESEATDPRRILDGDNSLTGWRFTFTPEPLETVAFIEAEIFVDLQNAESLQQINIVLEAGTVLTDFVYTSPDNRSWTSYTTTTINAPAGSVRFIRFRVRKTAAETGGSWTLAVFEVQLKTATTLTPAAAIDGDVYTSNWKPRPSDVDPKLTVDFGVSRTFNAIYTYWGSDSFDFWNRVNYYMESSTDGVNWARIADLNGLNESGSLFGDVEHVVNPITCRYIRVNIKGRSGVCKLRHIKAVNVTATQYADKVIKDVLATAGITKHRIPQTRRFVVKRLAEVGEEKEAFCRLVATGAGWVDPYMDEAGYYITGPRNINPVSPAWDFGVDTDNIFSFEPGFSNDISNVIIVVYKSSEGKAIVGRAMDADPLSPTYIGDATNPGLGRRVFKYEAEAYDTQDKCDLLARQKLFERTRFKHQTSLPITGHPGIQPDDVVVVTVLEAKVNRFYYLVTGYAHTFDAESATFDTRINITQL